jgi:murein L,D-transpeptidase YcbB/YkuD
MRRATICLLSTLALAAPLPAVAQDESKNTQPIPASAPVSDPIITSSIPDARPAEPGAATNAPTDPAPASSAEPPAAAPTSPPAAPVAPTDQAAPATPALPALNTALLEAIEKGKPLARQGTEREWHSAISAFYTARQGRPLWMTDNGPTTAAEALVAEMGRADEWGLDPKAFDLAGLPSRASDAQTLAAGELKITRALVTYAWHARGGRLDPSQLSKWLDQSPRPLDAKALLEDFAKAGDPSVALQKLHPQHRQFELLRQAYLKARGERPAEPVKEDPREALIPNGPTVRVGDRHPHVVMVRKRLGLPIEGGDADLYDEDVAEGVREYLGATYRDSRTGKTVRRPEHPPLTNLAREALSRPKRQKQASAPAKVTLKQYLVNLERWRWLPENLGTTHVWNNLPEFTTRVFENDRVVHQERIIIGKPDTQTPVFSDEMRFVVFHPDWGVPGTIKVQDLLPSLSSGDDSVLRRRNMRIVSGTRSMHPSEIDWSRTDIRKVSIVQDPGPSNPLGQLKFMFPNKHDVYMHDTPNKNLFDSGTRAFSFGCIRVRNPVRLAEVVFGRDRNWTQTDITGLLTPRAQQNNRVDLNRRIPVHNTYFTLIADEDGKVTSFADVYGHDKRIQAALLDGESVDVVARTDPALALERKVKTLASAPRPPRDEYSSGGGWGGWGWGPPPKGKRGGSSDFFSGIFGN